MRTLDALLRWAAVLSLWALILLLTIPTAVLIVASWAGVWAIEALTDVVGEVRP